MPMYIKVNPIIDVNMRSLCKSPYPNHPKGCPNYNKKDGCPPKALIFNELIDISKTVYAVYNKFDFGKHVQKMRNKHPAWSKRQVECCLYWQPRARSQLKEGIASFLMEHPGLFVVKCPEACGVNLTQTMMDVGIKLEWPPVHYTYQIVLCGTKL